uniref:Conserved oligomeric Golgi complex subunit 6 n=1 Tax=Angiostrongylus cantonensis TaxID=6313 RepID=A0A158P5W3_ANGCA
MEEEVSSSIVEGPPPPHTVDSSATTTNPIKRKIDKLISSKLHNDPEFLKVVDYVAPMVGDLDIHTERRLVRIRTMHRICADLTNRIQQNKEKTQDLLSKTSALQNQKRHLEAKQKAIDDFLGKYSLTDLERKALEGNPNGHFYYNVEIMEEMSQTLEKAYEVLYRSVQSKCLMKILCIRRMSNFECGLCRNESRAMSIFCSSRRKGNALTKGTYSNGKPIELMSHDPLRYIGDMLAWIYESIESERELIQMLFKDCSPQVIRDNSIGLLSKISSALCRPFKLRVEQALAGETDSIVLFQLNQLTLNIFYSGLSAAVQKILSRMTAPDYDLLPVPAVHQILMLLRDVLETHDGAMVGRKNSEEEFDKIFACVLDPLCRSVQVAATHLHSPLDVAVYTLNCLTAIYSVVILYPFTDSRLEMIKALMEGNEDVLVSEEASTILANTGFITLYQKAAAHDRNQGPLSLIAGMDSATVSRIFAQFDVFLAQPDKYQLDQVSKISSVRARETVQQRTADNVAAAYAVVIRKLEDPFNAYEDIGFKSVEQVRAFRNLGNQAFPLTVSHKLS